MAYQPQRPSANNLEDWVYAELLRISQELQSFNVPVIQLAPQAAAPERPREGMVAHADGTNWNPGGTGKGLYLYSSGAWAKL